ncbi:MAG: glutathione S-transferase family protein [Bdellovibrionales bacterium]|nr:glutathione S-transferase family protein [Bdellovibrionales bacterium]
MAYTLITSERSPFGRTCRMFMHANNIPFELHILNFVDNAQDAQALSAESPINKVPILADGTQKIFDSRVIGNYLMAKHGIKPLTAEEENIVSAVYSCTDVSVTLFLMKNSGYDIQASNPYLNRQRERIPKNLDYIKPWTTSLRLQDWNFASMSLYSFLYWAPRRAKTIELAKYPHFTEFLTKFAGAPGVKETTFS